MKTVSHSLEFFTCHSRFFQINSFGRDCIHYWCVYEFVSVPTSTSGILLQVLALGLQGNQTSKS